MNRLFRHFRALVVVARPAVIFLLATFAALGLAAAGRPNDTLVLATVLVVVFSYLLFSVTVNDLADQAIDELNLPGDTRRPLVTGVATRLQFGVIAVTAALLAVAGAAWLGWWAIAVTVAGLVISAAYSLPPIRLAKRGVLASLVLPAAYVAVPFLLGVLGAGRGMSQPDLVLLSGLYVGFIGRIVLKDFRDVRGDALFGKRTFLVRHGRGCTCLFSAVFLTMGTVALAALRGATMTYVGGEAVFLALALIFLRALATDGGVGRDEALISAIAISGRGVLVTLLAHLSMRAAHWPSAAYQAVMIGLVVAMAGRALTMARRGPSTRLHVPQEFVTEAEHAASVQTSTNLFGGAGSGVGGRRLTMRSKRPASGLS